VEEFKIDVRNMHSEISELFIISTKLKLFCVDVLLIVHELSVNSKIQIFCLAFNIS